MSNDAISPFDDSFSGSTFGSFDDYAVPISSLPSEEEVRAASRVNSKYPILWNDTFPRFVKMPSYTSIEDLKEVDGIKELPDSFMYWTDVLFLAHGMDPRRMASGLTMPDCIYSKILGPKNTSIIRNNFMSLSPVYDESCDPRIGTELGSIDVFYQFRMWLKATHPDSPEWGHEYSISPGNSQQNLLMKALWPTKTVAFYVYNLRSQRIEIFSMSQGTDKGGFNISIKRVLDELAITHDIQLDCLYNPYTLLHDDFLRKANPDRSNKLPVVRFKCNFPKRDKKELRPESIKIGVVPNLSYIEKNVETLYGLFAQIKENPLHKQRVFYSAEECLSFLADSTNPLDKTKKIGESFPDFFSMDLEEIACIKTK